jgi:hypothetical protein
MTNTNRGSVGQPYAVIRYHKNIITKLYQYDQFLDAIITISLKYQGSIDIAPHIDTKSQSFMGCF